MRRWSLSGQPSGETRFSGIGDKEMRRNLLGAQSADGADGAGGIKQGGEVGAVRKEERRENGSTRGSSTHMPPCELHPLARPASSKLAKSLQEEIEACLTEATLMAAVLERLLSNQRSHLFKDGQFLKAYLTSYLTNTPLAEAEQEKLNAFDIADVEVASEADAILLRCVEREAPGSLLQLLKSQGVLYTLVRALQSNDKLPQREQASLRQIAWKQHPPVLAVLRGLRLEKQLLELDVFPELIWGELTNTPCALTVGSNVANELETLHRNGHLHIPEDVRVPEEFVNPAENPFDDQVVKAFYHMKQVLQERLAVIKATNAEALLPKQKTLEAVKANVIKQVQQALHLGKRQCLRLVCIEQQLGSVAPVLAENDILCRNVVRAMLMGDDVDVSTDDFFEQKYLLKLQTLPFVSDVLTLMQGDSYRGAVVNEQALIIYIYEQLKASLTPGRVNHDRLDRSEEHTS